MIRSGPTTSLRYALHERLELNKQDRMSDHRIGLNLTGLREIMDGDGLDLIVGALRNDFNARRLESILAGEEDLDE